MIAPPGSRLRMLMRRLGNALLPLQVPIANAATWLV